jgi:hypothetical protein
MLDEMRRVTTVRVLQLTQELEVEYVKERKAISAAVHDHLDPGNNYWQHRHRAEQKLLAACALLQILEAA